VPLFGDGRNLMSLIDVEDCAGLVAHAIRNSQPGKSYNLLVPGACVTQLDFAERLAQLTHTSIEQLSRPEIKRRYGHATLEAVTFSNRASTQRPEFIAGCNFNYPSVDAMIRHNLPVDLVADSKAQSFALNE
jgi:NAD dependent epimerase/dehydratase family enzyme